MKKIVLIVCAILAIIFGVQFILNENNEYTYALNVPALIQLNDQKLLNACAVEAQTRSENDDKLLTSSELGDLVVRGIEICSLEMYVVPANIAVAYFEAKNVPLEMTIPYEAGKRALGANKTLRCSDYVEPLIMTCPKLLQAYFDKVEPVDSK